jgi:exopolysaccharide production protein ExoZ
LQPTDTTRNSAFEEIRSVQCLRALAALFVVGFHATLLLHDNFTPNSWVWDNGNAGVDLFFVISGFIMVVSSRRLVGQADGWRRFITARLSRIVPMYWLATTAKLLSIAAIPEMARHTSLTVWNTIASFLFLPSFDGAGIIKPVLPVGWTLSYEMLFYCVFAAALFLARDPLVVVLPVLAALTLVSLMIPPDWPAITSLASPFLLEFLFGVIIGRAFLAKWLQEIPAVWAIALGGAGLVGLAVLPVDGAWERVALWGPAAAAAVAGAVMCEAWLGRRLPDLFVQIGEASYSMYLTHVFVLPVIGVVLAKSGMTGLALAVALVSSCVVVSTITSLVAHKWVEAPMTRALRRLIQQRGARDGWRRLAFIRRPASDS